jgi:hypothetical protein
MTSMSAPLGNSGIDQRKILPLVSLEFRCLFSRIDISLQSSSAFVLTVEMTCKLYKIEENKQTKMCYGLTSYHKQNCILGKRHVHYLFICLLNTLKSIQIQFF